MKLSLDIDYEIGLLKCLAKMFFAVVYDKTALNNMYMTIGTCRKEWVHKYVNVIFIQLNFLYKKKEEWF